MSIGGTELPDTSASRAAESATASFLLFLSLRFFSLLRSASGTGSPALGSPGTAFSSAGSPSTAVAFLFSFFSLLAFLTAAWGSMSPASFPSSAPPKRRSAPSSITSKMHHAPASPSSSRRRRHRRASSSRRLRLRSCLSGSSGCALRLRPAPAAF
ncbi:hypothetical protein BC834DRAFT_909581 [Gloeopeniophorella convolvens]|nr:hypothetical protein BC834DRAFT_909581 [Gloeopeniophorella convolvens]